MNNNVRQIGYEQTDRKNKVNIYGLDFYLNEANNEFYNKLKSFKDSNPNTLEELYSALDIFLGEGAADKINAKRAADGYDNLSVANLIVIINFIVEESIKAAREPITQLESNVNKIKGLNREHRRKGYR